MGGGGLGISDLGFEISDCGAGASDGRQTDVGGIRYNFTCAAVRRGAAGSAVRRGAAGAAGDGGGTAAGRRRA
jgi:hypothetical protein